jgi:hypothetical protein
MFLGELQCGIEYWGIVFFQPKGRVEPKEKGI